MSKSINRHPIRAYNRCMEESTSKRFVVPALLALLVAILVIARQRAFERNLTEYDPSSFGEPVKPI